MPSKTQLPLFPDFEQLLSNFNDEGVDYLLEALRAQQKEASAPAQEKDE